MADRIVVMNHGAIVQVGTPLEIYRAPATPFVADFVGTMNFLPGVAVGPRRVRLGGIELECAGDLDGLEKGSAVTLCVRPEDLTVQGEGRDNPNAMPARVDDLEFLGAFYRATLAVEGMGEERLTADFAPNLVQSLDIREGAKLTVVFPNDRIRVFAKE
jgi:iron(III) transport system ATP-binding protein